MKKFQAFCRNVKHSVRCYFSPFNVVKIQELPRTWCDRDHVMMHAMFQILVDFVELEQPFREYDAPRTKRHNNIDEMYAWNEKHFGFKTRETHYGEGASEEDKVKCDAGTAKRWRVNLEILYLYGWYRARKYEKESDDMVNFMLERILWVREYLWT